MKRTVLLSFLCLIVIVKARPQVVLNEIYSDPGAGKDEFFEFYNTGSSTLPTSMDHYTIVTYFEQGSQKGFYVLDLPNLFINPQGYFVGSSDIPFDYQGVTGSTASDFSWNSPSLALNNGYLKKWVQGSANLLDGNSDYDEATLPSNFNDFFYRRTGAGSSYTVFVYLNGQLVNTFIGGTGGNTTIIETIVNMPQLNVDMVNPLSTDFTINFGDYSTIPLEYCIQDAGSDNGYIRERDGVCGLWVKSSAGVQHTPKQSNGPQADETTGFISISTTITKGDLLSGSIVNYDIVSAPASSFPVELMVYLDNGTTMGVKDPADTYVESSIHYAVSDPLSQTTFFPYTSNILVVVKAAAGCIDKIQFIPNINVLSVNLLSFTGNASKTAVMLDWAVGKNEGAERYEVERSDDGKDFTTIAVIFASAKLGAETYGIHDNLSLKNKKFYRLKMIGKDQHVEYSRTLTFQPLTQESAITMTIVNNPVTDKLAIHFAATETGTTELSVYDLFGRKLLTKTFTVYEGGNQYSTPLPYSMSNGVYVVEVKQGVNRYTAKFVKQ